PSLHDALPISIGARRSSGIRGEKWNTRCATLRSAFKNRRPRRARNSNAIRTPSQPSSSSACSAGNLHKPMRCHPPPATRLLACEPRHKLQAACVVVAVVLLGGALLLAAHP